jgi:hypothetical protein
VHSQRRLIVLVLVCAAALAIVSIARSQQHTLTSAGSFFTALSDSNSADSSRELGANDGGGQGGGKPKKRKFDERINIMNYKPPANANPLHTTQWDKAVSETWGVVRAYPLGGTPLRDFIHTEVGKLKMLREELFAMVPEEL